MIRTRNFYLRFYFAAKVLAMIIFLPILGFATPQARIERNLAEIPQHLLYLHFDRQEYLSGDTLWFKAYLANAATKTPLQETHRLTIELINVQNQVVSVSFVQIENGLGHGYIAFSPLLPGGNYQIRAYTDWMKNFDSNLFFTRELFLVSPSELEFANPRQARINRNFNNKLQNKKDGWQVQFFPESGNLLAGVDNTIAFMATDGLGRYLQVSGEVLGSNRQVVATFRTETPGYGTFTLNPSMRGGYNAVVRNEDGRELRIALPAAVASGFTVTANLLNDQINIVGRRNFEPATADEKIFLMGLTNRGIEYFESVVFIDRSFQVYIPAEGLPTGIIHWVMLDASMKLLAQRSQFVNNFDFTKVTVDVFALAVQPATGFEVNVNVNLGPQNLDQGNFSMAVTSVDDAAVTAPTPDGGIIEKFLLSGNLGQLPNSAWKLLQENTQENRRKLDLIVMTNPWKRFQWDKLSSAETPTVTFPAASMFTISGQITSPQRGTIRNPAEVRLLLQGDLPRQFTTRSGVDGSFTFTNVQLLGSVSAEISATSRDLPGQADIVLNPYSAVTVDYLFSPNTRPHTTEMGANRPTDRLLTHEATSSIARITQRDQRGGTSFASPDQVIFINETIEQQLRTVFDVLRTKGSGINISSGRILLRGPTSIRGSSEPLFGVDGMFTSRDHLLSLRTTEIERIEIYKGPSASIFGVRGANGVIMAHSRTGRDLPTISANYALTGFQPQREFSSKQEPYGTQVQNLPKTWHWLPNITPDNSGIASLWLRFPQNPGKIRVIVQGIDAEGNLYYGEQIVEF